MRFDRNRKVQQLIGRMTMPRVQMFVILAFAGVAGFVVSLGMLRAGINLMALRYPVAIAAAYVVFLLLLRLWIGLQRGDGPNVDMVDIADVGNWPQGPTGSTGPNMIDTPRFAGGGAGGEWADAGGSARKGWGGSGGSGGSWDIDLDLDDLGAIILAIAAILAALLAVFYVIYVAPVLLAEILIDAAVVGGVYRSMRNVERRYWLTTAVRKTVIPAVLAILLFGVAGYLFQKAVPEAHSIGQVWSSIAG